MARVDESRNDHCVPRAVVAIVESVLYRFFQKQLLFLAQGSGLVNSQSDAFNEIFSSTPSAHRGIEFSQIFFCFHRFLSSFLVMGDSIYPASCQLLAQFGAVFVSIFFLLNRCYTFCYENCIRAKDDRVKKRISTIEKD